MQMKDRHGTSDSGIAAVSGRSFGGGGMMIDSDLEEEESQRISSSSYSRTGAVVSFRTRMGELQQEQPSVRSSRILHDGNLNQQHEETATRRSTSTRKASSAADARGVAAQARERILEQEAAAKKKKKEIIMMENDDEKKNSQKVVSISNKTQEAIPDVELGTTTMNKSLSERSQNRRQSEGLLQPSSRGNSLIEEPDDLWNKYGQEEEENSKSTRKEHSEGEFAQAALDNGDPTNTEDQDDSQRPGAVAVRGRAFGQFPVWGRHRPNQDTNRPRGLIGSIRNSLSLRSSNLGTTTTTTAVAAAGVASVPQAAEVHDATPIVFPESIATPNDLAREEQASKRRKRYCYAAVAFLVVVTLAVGIALGFGLGEAQNDKDGGSESDSDAVCEDIGEDPTLVLQCRCNEQMEQPSTEVVEEFGRLADLLEVNATDDITQACEEQNLALWWLANDTVSGEALEEFEKEFMKENSQGSANNNDTAMDDVCAMNRTQFLNQRYVLAVMYLTMNGFEWEKQAEWLTSNSTCHWQGVGCSFGTSSQVVFRLRIAGQNATGTIPPEVGRLCGLRDLDLSHNELTGSVPSDLLMDLKYLRRIVLKRNQLTGEIPDVTRPEGPNEVKNEVANLNLTIPDILENFTLLEPIIDKVLDRRGPFFVMDFSNNNFTGTFPVGVGLLTTLLEIRADNNHLKSLPTPPDGISLFGDLEVISVGGNELTGTIPTTIGLLSRLEILNLGENMLTGTLVSEIGNLEELTSLRLSFNNFTSTIPDSFSRLVRLTELDVRNRELKGPVPDDLCDSLTFLDPGVWVNCNGTLDEGCGCCLCGRWPRPGDGSMDMDGEE